MKPIQAKVKKSSLVYMKLASTRRLFSKTIKTSSLGLCSLLDTINKLIIWSH
jgi:hypothetical protein